MRNLFIIGNGFDRAHGFQTNYADFRAFLVHAEREECARAGVKSISDDHSLLGDDAIRRYFDEIVNPAMMDALPHFIDQTLSKDASAGKAPVEQLNEIHVLLNEINEIVQWIKHGTGEYYARKANEPEAVKRFIAMLEPETGMISHATDLTNLSAYWQLIGQEFGESTAKLLDSDSGIDTIPFWLMLRFSIKLIDSANEGDWNDLETTMGEHNIEKILELFKNTRHGDDIRAMHVYRFFVSLYNLIAGLFATWIIFVETGFEQDGAALDLFATFRPRVKKGENGLELIMTMKKGFQKPNPPIGGNPSILETHPAAKRLLLRILGRAESNCFLSFNYTRTLERIYGINHGDICYIHGVAENKEDSNNFTASHIIFGHGREFPVPDVADIVATAYNINRKPVRQCIENNRRFFNKLENVDNIYSYGFSFSNVDMPYISEVCRSIRDATNAVWHFNNYNIENNRMAYEGKLRGSGFKGRFDVFHAD